MSLASKITFGLCCATAIGTIFYVHYKQEADRKQLHAGVERDIERQARRKIQNLYMLNQQRELTNILRKEQERETKLEAS